jgi:hypothetical protein
MPISSQEDPNKDAVYEAEHTWQGRNPDAGAELTSRQARLLSKQILNHPALDGVPGVDKARKSILAKVNIRTRLIGRLAPGTIGATNGLGMTLYSKDTPITAGTVTHETTHKILVKRGGVEPHGPEFSRLHSHVVNSVFGSAARSNLTAIYDRNGVRR